MAFDAKGKSKEEIIEHMMAHVGGVDYPLFDALQAAIQAKIADQLVSTANTARDDFIRTIGALKSSIDQFEESNRRASKALNWLTFVIAFAAIVQLILFAWRIGSP